MEFKLHVHTSSLGYVVLADASAWQPLIRKVIAYLWTPVVTTKWKKLEKLE